MSIPSMIRPSRIVTRFAVALVAVLMLASGGARAESRVFIPTGSANAVLIVDPVEDRVVGRIDGVSAVHGLAATPDGRYLVAGSYDERPFGSAAPARPAGVSQADHEAHHAGAPRGEGRGKTVSTVSVIDLETQAVTRRIDVPGAVHHVAIDRPGRHALVTHPNGGGVTAIDLSSFKVTATLATGELPNYVAFSPDGGTAYVSNAGDDTVSVIDTAAWQVVKQIAVGDSPEHLVLSQDGRRLFVNNVEAGSVSVIATDSRQVDRTFEFGGRLHGIDLSTDGETLFVAVTDRDRVIAVGATDGMRKAARDLPAPYHAAVIRSSGKLYVSSAVEPVVRVLDTATLDVLSEIPTGDIGHQMAETDN